MNSRSSTCHECGGEIAEEFSLPPHQNLRARHLARLHPSEEMALAMELLAVNSEAELDHFFGNMFKKVWGGIKKAASFVGKAAKPFAGALKSLAKKALPFVGKALGTFIPIPGVGTAIGGALGSALGNALEMELAHLEREEQEFEQARRFVRIVHIASHNLAGAAPSQPLASAIHHALADAVRNSVSRAPGTAAANRGPANRGPSNRGAASIGSGGFGFTNSGAWRREGRTLVLEL